MPQIKSHGGGKFRRQDFKKIGKNVVIEPGVLVFHPESITIGNNVYIGHNTILNGYHLNQMVISDNVWIGQNCFLHSAGGILIEEKVGIGPGVSILTSAHDLLQDNLGPILDLSLKFNKVVVGKGCDIGINSTILPGVELSSGVQVGAGSVITKSFSSLSIIAGIPAKLLRKRKVCKK